MCGIFSIISNNSKIPELRKSIRCRDTMAHRGPDGAGLWESSDRRVCLAHRRLSVIDLGPAAAQPMVDTSGSVALVFNGEIYNHGELRLRLPEVLLMRIDKMGMGVGLEARVLFMDHGFVKYAMGIPAAMKTRSGES